ncbi:MAG: hypothetical protein K6G07_06645 [Lachnospiraceae bacterium]|nr:hypothetical protein [Lachnospiraceae bacterium]
MKRFKGTKGAIILVILACLIVGYYFYLSNRNISTDEQEPVDAKVLTMTESALARSLETNYPPTPREVVKYFSEMTMCLYNEEHTPEELNALGRKMREIYDEELVANQSEEQYLSLLSMDVDEYIANNRTISSYSISSSIDVENFSMDGYDCARLYAVYDVKQDSLLYQTNLVFILRKDATGHYKIYGWKKYEEE